MPLQRRADEEIEEQVRSFFQCVANFLMKTSAKSELLIQFGNLFNVSSGISCKQYRGWKW